jgi:basic membrane protein A
MKKVAMITDWGAAKDSYGNLACWQAMETWCREKGVDYVCYESREDTMDERVLRVVQAIAEGADTVVLSGYLFGSVMAVVRDVYPDVKFLGIDVDAGDLTLDYQTVYEPTDNMTCLTFCEEQAAYLAGYAAVREGYRKLGYQGGMDVPAVVRSGYGFVQGADAAAVELGVNIEIHYAYARQYFGNAALTSQLKQWYEDGTEVVFTYGGGVYTSVIEAAQEAGSKVIGSETNPEAAEDCVITSVSKNLAEATTLALQAVWEDRWGDFGGKAIRLSLTDGDSVGLAANEEAWGLEQFTVEDYLAVKDKIAAGTIVVNASGDKTVKPEVSGFTTVHYPE